MHNEMTDELSGNEYEVNPEEKLLALFAHLSIFYGAVLIPLIFWIINTNKSRFISFHSLQALFLHLAYFIFIILIVIFFSSVLIVNASLLQGSGTREMPPSIVILTVVFISLIFLSLFAVSIYSVYASIKSYKGEIVRYPIIGNIIYRKIYRT